MRSKRPWKKFAFILRRERNNGDVVFDTDANIQVKSPSDRVKAQATFEDLTSAEQHLDAWWAEWWPKQTKKVSRA